MMETIIQALIDFAKWIIDLVKALFLAVTDFIKDIFVTLAEIVFQALLAIIQAIPVPQFASTGLSSTLAQIPSDVWFFASHLKFTQCFAILSAAFAFRLARKVATLFQW